MADRRVETYDLIAQDLAQWLDEMSTQLAVALSPQGVAPFAAPISEQQKLAYYSSQLFMPDGTPNEQGRNAELQRLGPIGFRTVYRAVIEAYPWLKLPAPPEGTAPSPLGPTPMPIPAMAEGGIVTQPTVALIGEAGPEAVVPLNGSSGQQPDPDLAAHLGGTPGPGATPPTPSHDDITAYIRQAAAVRGIDPNAALAVAMHEGTNPATGRFDSPAQEAVFPTGRSYWPFQLHYGGAGTPYAQYGSVAGMGNDFTAQTGWQPGDPRAWKDATDFALDQAIANPKGWAQWYGSVPARVAPRQGLPQR